MNPRIKALCVLLALATVAALFKGRKWEVLFWIELAAVVPALLVNGQRGRRV